MTLYDKYCIISGYITRPEEVPLDITIELKGLKSIQEAVYERAQKIFNKSDYSSVLDLGCGSGYELVTRFTGTMLGIEVEPNYERLLKNYPNHRWIEADYCKSLNEEFDMVICADVLEHVLDPDIIMQYMVNINPKCVVLSTPAREQLPPLFTLDNGPPKNQRHIREWTTQEFVNYASKWFGPPFELEYTSSYPGITLIAKRS